MQAIMQVARIYVIIMLLLLYTRAGQSQSWYFNEVYNPNGTWACGMSIMGINSGFIGCSISGDSISDYYYQTSTFLMNPSGDIISWKNFGKDGCDFWPGDDGSLTKNNSYFGLFGTVQDFINDSIYGLFYKFDESGDTVLTKTFTSDSDTIFVGRVCTTTIDGGYTLLGNVSGNEANKDIIIISVDSNGNEFWRNRCGSDSNDWAKSIIQTPDKGYAIGSWRRIGSQLITADPIVIKTDSLGNFEWSVNLGGPYMDDVPMICNSQDSCIIVLTAYADSMLNPEYACTRTNIIKLNLQGEIIWNKKFNTSETLNYISNIICVNNGDLLACGESLKSAYLPRAGWLFRFNADGDSLWYRDYYYYPEDENFGTNFFYDLSQTADNGFVAVGQAYTLFPPDNVQKMWVLKVDSTGCEIPNCWVGIEEDGRTIGREDGKNGELEIWPNPVSGVVDCRWPMVDFRGKCSLVIYDMYGKEIREVPVPENEREIQFDVGNFAPGLYLVVLKNESKIIGSAKMVVSG